jgi:Phage major capsid protein E
MAQPTLSDVHVNALLTDLSNMYSQEESNFIARDVFPIVPVSKISDRYLTYSRADFNRNQMQKRAPSTLVKNIGYRTDTNPSYLCDVWALGKAIDDQIRGNADAVFNLDLEATRLLTMQSLINREYFWMSTFFTTGVWSNTWAGGAANSAGGYPTAPATSTATSYTALKWSDPNSTPIQDIRTLKRIAQLTSTFRPNKMVLSRGAFDTLVDHPDFIDRIKYGGNNGKVAIATLEILAAIFELDRVHVSDAIYNTAGELANANSGATYAAPGYNVGVNAGESNAFLAGNHVWIGYTPSRPGLMTPGCGYTFAWTGYFGATQAGERLSSYYFQPDRSTHVEIESAYIHKLVSADMGAFIGNIV